MTAAVATLRARGVYEFTVNGRRHVTIHDDGGLYTADEWLDSAAPDWGIADDGRLAFQGDARLGGGLTAADLVDTGFDVVGNAGETFSATVGTRTVAGTDWPVVAEIVRADEGATEDGEPVAWWVRVYCPNQDGGAEFVGAPGETFTEALDYALSAE